MIDELDAFNAIATLAIARIARFPFQTGPELASQVAPLAQLSPSDVSVEEQAAKWIFGRWAKGATLFDVYRMFWGMFPPPAEPATLRLAVNAPCPLPGEKGGLLDVVCDPRLKGRSGMGSVPDRWAMPLSAESNHVDDVLLFSEDGLSGDGWDRLVGLIGVGTTVTFMRPGLRCDPWFLRCGARHDFGAFMSRLSERAEFDQVHRGEPSDPVMVTALGVTALRL